MATVNPTITRGKNRVTFTYANLTSANASGAALGKHWDDYPDRSVMMNGVWNGSTVAWQGTNDGTTFFNLTDPQGGAIAKTANAIEQVMEISAQQKPVMIIPDPLANVTVTVVARRSRSGMEP